MRKPNFSYALSSARKATSLALATVVVVTSATVFIPNNVQAAMTALSITGTGITANSSAINAAITPTINFTPATAIGATDQLVVTLNGTITSASLASADVTVGGGCSGTVTIAGSPIAISTSNPVLTITGVTCTAATPATVVVAASRLAASATAGNYGIFVTSPADTGAFFYYVGDENDVQINATVDSVLSFVIRNTADNADQPNVGGGAVGPNLCDLGNLSAGGVQTCSYRLKVATNASGGYVVTLATDGSLRKGSDFINNVAENTLVTAGTEGYGIEFNGGAATVGSVTESGDFADDDTPIATGLVAGINTSLYSVNGPNNPTGTDTTNTALVTHRAESDAGTPAGQYTQLATYTVAPNY